MVIFQFANYNSLLEDTLKINDLYLVVHPTYRKWVKQPWLFQWDKWGQVVHSKNWGELTHQHDSWVVHHQVNH